jgi:putative PEP-CTERM system TPR-repeat lipoprotein
MRSLRAVGIAGIVLVISIIQGCDLSSDPNAFLAKAHEYRKQADYRAAIIELKNVLQKAPDHAEARYLLGLSYNDSGDFRSAEDHLRRALELGYEPAKVAGPLGKSLIMTGQAQRVLTEIKLEENVNDETAVAVLTVRGLALVELGRASEGRGLLAQALAKRPDYADALLGQARIAATERKFEEAMSLTERVIKGDPRNPEAWLMKASLLRVQGNQEGSVAAYQHIFSFDPRNVPAHLALASLNVANGKLDEARKHISEVRKIVPGHLMAIHMQALIELRERNYAAARNTALQVLRAVPDHLPTVLVAGTAEAALGSHEQAQVHLRRVLESAPNYLYARRLLASSLAQTGQVGRAIEVLQPALKQTPGDVPLVMLAGELYMHAGDFEKAQEYFAKAAKQAPKSAVVRTRLGASKLATGDTENALADFESAVQLGSDQYQADVLLVTSHLRQKNYDEALKAAQRLEEKQPKNPLTYNLKAAAYIGKKDLSNARKQLEQALAIQPTYVPAAMNLARLDIQEGNPQAARRRLEAILDNDKANAAALLGLATLAPRIGATPNEQIAWLERARKASPRSVQPHLLLAGAYTRQGDRKKALEAAQQAQAISPEDPRVLDILGIAQLGAGEKENALQTFRKLAAQQPNSHVVLHHLARAEVLNGNQSAAVSALKKALSIKPDFGAAQIALFELDLKAKRYADAMKIAKQVQQQAGSSPVGYMLEGDTLMAEKKFAQAAKVYDTAYEHGKSGLLAVKLHTAYTNAGKPAEADARLTQWLKESPSDVAARIYAADLSIKRGNYKEAVTHYEALPQKQRESVVVLNNLAWSYHQANDPRALETAERAYKQGPTNPAVADTLGTILMEQGNTQRALDVLQKGVAAAPKMPQLRYRLAQAWLKSGDKSKAKEQLQLLLTSETKFPQREEAAKLLKELSN